METILATEILAEQDSRLPMPAPVVGSLLYAINGGLGGRGLDLVATESLRDIAETTLGKVIVFRDRSGGLFPANRVETLEWHPVRLLSGLDRPYYYGAKKHAIDKAAARELLTGKHDFFHGWAGDCLRTLEVAKKMGIPSMIEIPTCHVRSGFGKWSDTAPEPIHWQTRALPKRWRERLLVTAKRIEREYELADLLLIRSDWVAETFLANGISEKKLFYVGDGADVDRFSPAAVNVHTPEARQRPTFRAIFAGSLGRRKGVDLLLEAWAGLKLGDAELTLLGHAQPEFREVLERNAMPNVRVVKSTSCVEEFLRTSDIHVFPSHCEGCAKTTIEAAACGLPQIATRESGNVVKHEENGWVIPRGDVNALSAALKNAYDCFHKNSELWNRMKESARARTVNAFTWSHFRQRLEQAKVRAVENCRAN